MDFRNDPRFKGIKPFPEKCWLSSPTMHGDEQRWVNEAIKTNWVSTVGENIDAIEDQMAKYVGRKYAVALSSGTAALHLAVRLAGQRLYGQPRPGHGTLEGRKVLCSDLTFAASANPVAYEGGEAVFIDAEYDTWNMDPVALERAFQIYPEARLVVLAHLYGTPAKMGEIRRICDAHHALIVEDAAESLGAKYWVSSSPHSSPGHSQGVSVAVSKSENVGDREGFREVDEDERSEESEKSDVVGDSGGSEGLEGNAVGSGGRDPSARSWLETGTLGDYSCISFNGNKIITGSSGGMFLTDSQEDAEKVRRWSTQSRETAPWYQHEEIGYNYRMSNLVAGVVRGQLPYLSEHVDRKRAIWEHYEKGLADLPVRMNPWNRARSKPNFWLSCMIIEGESMTPHVRGEREELWVSESGKSSPGEILYALAVYNVEGRPIWKPMHLQPIYRNHAFVTLKGNSRGWPDAYIGGTGEEDVGADIFRRGLCLPSDIKMSEEEQDRIISIVKRCFG